MKRPTTRLRKDKLKRITGYPDSWWVTLNSSTQDASSYGLFAKNVSLIAIANGMLSLRGLFFIPIISKELGAGAYGIWAQVILFVSISSSISTLGLANAISRFLAGKDNKDELREGFYSSLTISILIAILSIIVTRLGLWLFKSSISSWSGLQVVDIGLWLIPFAAVDLVYFSYMTARRRMKAFAILSVMKAYGEVTLVYIFVSQGYELVGAIQGTLLAHILVTAVLIAIVALDIGFKIPKFGGTRRYLNYSIPTIATVLSGWVLAFSDRYVIGLYLGDIQTGIYSAAFSIGHAINFLLPPLTIVLNPTIFRLWEQGKKKRAVSFQRMSLKFLIFLSVPAAFGITFLAKPTLLLLSTPEMAEGGAPIVPFVALSMVFYGISMIISRVYPLHHDTKTSGTIWTLAAIFNVITNFLLIPVIGIVGAAITTLVSRIFAFILILGIGRKYMPHLSLPPIWFTAKSVAASGIMLLVLYLVRPFVDFGPLFMILSLVPLGIGIYIALMWVFRCFRENELDFIKQLIRGGVS